MRIFTVRTISNVAALMLAGSVSSVSGIVSTYYIVRSVTQPDFGTYHFYLAIMGIATFLALPGMGNALLQSVARGFSGSYRGALAKVLRFSAFGSVLLACASVTAYALHHPELAQALIIIAIFLPFTYGIALWQSRLLGEEKFRCCALINALNAILTAVGLITASQLFPGNLPALLVVAMAVPAVINLIMTIRDLRSIAVDSPIEEQMIDYGYKTSFYSLAELVVQNIDKLILYFLSPIEVALFAAASRIDNLMKGVGSDIAAVFAPKFARDRYCQRATHRQILVIALLLSALAILFAFTVLPRLLELIYGNSYCAAIPYMQVLILSMPFTVLQVFRMRYIRSHLDACSFRNVHLLYAASKLGATALLVPFFGMAGAVGATWLSRLALFFQVRYIFKKNFLRDECSAGELVHQPVVTGQSPADLPRSPCSLPIITIGITAYNAEATIARALGSACKQNWPNLEILVVDDCSTDLTSEIIHQAARCDPRIRYLRTEENAGPAVARNLLVDAASGEYIAFFDDDDESLSDRLMSQYRVLREQEELLSGRRVACYATSMRRYPGGYEVLRFAIGTSGPAPDPQQFLEWILLGKKVRAVDYGSGTPTNTLFIRTSDIRATGGFSPVFRRVEDIDFSLRFALEGGVFVGCRPVTVVQYATEATDKTPEANLHAELLLARKFIPYLKDARWRYYAEMWPYARYYGLTRQYIPLLGVLGRLFVRYPAVTLKHFANSAIARYRHECKIHRTGPASTVKSNGDCK